MKDFYSYSWISHIGSHKRKNHRIDKFPTNYLGRFITSCGQVFVIASVRAENENLAYCKTCKKIGARKDRVI